MEILLKLAKNSWKPEGKFSGSALFGMKTRVSLKYFVDDCLWKYLCEWMFFNSNSTQITSNLISLTISVSQEIFDTVLT